MIAKRLTKEELNELRNFKRWCYESMSMVSVVSINKEVFGTLLENYEENQEREKVIKNE